MPFLNRFSNRLLLIKNHDHRVPPIVQSYFLGEIGFAATNSARLNSVITDSSGNFYICGSIDDNGCLIIKLNSSGVIQWQKKLTDSTTTVGNSIAVDGNGNVYVCADYTYAGNNHIRIFKYNSSGTLVFKKGIYRGNNTFTFGQSIAVDSSGNIFILGTSDLSGYNFYIAKLNTSGAIQYQFNVGGASSFDVGYSLKLASSGNFYVAGACVDSGINGPSIIKYNNSGFIQWQKRINANVSSDVNVAVDSNENVYVAHRFTYDTGFSTAYRFAIVKFDTSGNIQWQKKIAAPVGYNSNDISYSIAVDSTGSAYILGSSEIVGSNDMNCFLTKVDTSGALIWQRTLKIVTFGNEAGNEIFIDSNDNIFMVGHSTAGSGPYSFFAKLPNDGSKTGTYFMAGSKSLGYQAHDHDYTITNTTYSISDSSFSNAGPALTIFDSFETETTPSLSPTIVNI
jgi:hypothetical protein